MNIVTHTTYLNTLLLLFTLFTSCRESTENTGSGIPELQKTVASIPTKKLPGKLLSSDSHVLPMSITVDSIFVDKSERRLQVFHKRKLLKTYRVALGRTPVGKKLQRGDNKTPEGLYHISAKVFNSTCHRALRISYPEERDRISAAKRHVDPGGDVMVHGIVNGYGTIGKAHIKHDWTYGCIAVTDQEIDELYRAVPSGTPIYIRP